MQRKAAAFATHHARFFVVFVAATTLALLLAAPSEAQADLDCANFDTQDEAQAVLNQDRSDPNGLDGDSDGKACEHLPSEGTGGPGPSPGGGQGAADLDCDDFATQAEAQAEYESDTSDPNGLDADNDDEACETFDYGTSAADRQYGSEPPPGKKAVIITTIPDKPLPKTGGFPLVVGAGLLLGSAAILGVRILRP